MIENISSVETYLYHYTKAKKALDDILKNRRLLLNNYTKTNDPKESKFWVFDLGGNEAHDFGKYNTTEMSLWLSAELKSRAKLACFSMDNTPLTGNHLADIHNRGFCKPRMWAQYSVDPKDTEGRLGVCLVFDRQKLLAQIKSQFDSNLLVITGPVQYRNRNLVRSLEDHEYMIDVDALESLGKTAYVNMHMRKHYGRLFFEKMLDWRDEAEWRVVVFLDSEKELYLRLEDSLVGIMFGENTGEEMTQHIMALTSSWNIEYMGLKWKNSTPWYDYNTFRYMPSVKKFLAKQSTTPP
jgi:Protein of unknown function (DUF2971)